MSTCQLSLRENLCAEALIPLRSRDWNFVAILMKTI